MKNYIPLKKHVFKKNIKSYILKEHVEQISFFNGKRLQELFRYIKGYEAALLDFSENPMPASEIAEHLNRIAVEQVQLLLINKPNKIKR